MRLFPSPKNRTMRGPGVCITVEVLKEILREINTFQKYLAGTLNSNYFVFALGAIL